MKYYPPLIYILIFALSMPLDAASNTFIDYQNYNHGYCPECNCYPCRCEAPPPAGEPTAYPGQDTSPNCPTCPSQVIAPPPPAGAVPPPPAGAPPPVPPQGTGSVCKKPDPCAPAPICGTNCGINLCWVGLAIAGVCAAAAIIVTSNNGSDPVHSTVR